MFTDLCPSHAALLSRTERTTAPLEAPTLDSPSRSQWTPAPKVSLADAKAEGSGYRRRGQRQVSPQPWLWFLWDANPLSAL